MRPRDYVLTAGALVLLASAAIVLLGQQTNAGELRPPDDPVVVDPPAPPAHGDAPGGHQVATGGPVRPSEVAVADPVFSRSDRVDTTGWTSGVIAGDIPLNPAVVRNIESISVVVDELRNVRAGDKPPFRRTVAVPLGIGTPTFRITDVPFSDYGYVVRAHSPGLNGGQATVTITEDTPYVDDVKLSITPGTPFSLLLRDQDRAPITYTEVTMVPFREPVGRPTFRGTTDNYGSVVFESVLAGDYRVHIGPQGQPMMEPPLVNVQPGAYQRRGSLVLPQGQTIEVPRGVPVTTVVTQPGGWPLQGARVQLRATDRRRLLELEALTDVRGRVEFPNVLPGQWELLVTMQDFQRRQKQLTVEAEAPEEQQFDLVRLR
ncbi:MAG: carboxypeptidase regulatory-like domain-containing protein [Planctomycetota bacterium]